MGGFLTRGFDSERQEGVGHGVSITRQSLLSSAMTAALTVRKVGPDTLGAERKIREGPIRGLPPPGSPRETARTDPVISLRLSWNYLRFGSYLASRLSFPSLFIHHYSSVHIRKGFEVICSQVQRDIQVVRMESDRRLIEITCLLLPCRCLGVVFVF